MCGLCMGSSAVLGVMKCLVKHPRSASRCCSKKMVHSTNHNEQARPVIGQINAYFFFVLPSLPAPPFPSALVRLT